MGQKVNPIGIRLGIGSVVGPEPQIVFDRQRAENLPTLWNMRDSGTN